MPPRRNNSSEEEPLPPSRPLATRSTSRNMSRGGGSSAQSSRPSSSNAAQSEATLLAPTAASKARHINMPSPVPKPLSRDASRKPSVPGKGKARKVTVEEVPDVDDPVSAPAQMSAFKANTGPVAGPSKQTSGLSRDASPSKSPPVVNNSPRPATDSARLLKPSSMESSLAALTSEGAKEGTSAITRELPPHLESESVTVALSLHARSESEERERYPKFFKGIGAVIDLYREPLYSSVERYHDVFELGDPTQDDLLLYYGAVDGLLPGADVEKSRALRDTIIRYQSPHRKFLWRDLSDTINQVYALSAEELELVSRIDQADQRTYFSLDLGNLELVAQTVVAVQQILDALSEFLGRRPSSCFVLDPKFAFLFMLERRADDKELRFALTTLQLRLNCADTHICSYLSRIRTILIGQPFTESVDSTLSTLSIVHEQYGSGTPTQELYRMIARRDYGRKPSMIDAEAHQQMVDSIKVQEEVDERPYKSRQRSVSTQSPLHEAPGHTSAALVANTSPRNDPPVSAVTIANTGGYLGPSSGVRFAGGHNLPLSSLNPFRPNTISSLPGAGLIRDTTNELVPGNGGPSVMRTPGTARVHQLSGLQTGIGAALTMTLTASRTHAPNTSAVPPIQPSSFPPPPPPNGAPIPFGRMFGNPGGGGDGSGGSGGGRDAGGNEGGGGSGGGYGGGDG
ncbi:hypothetical protein B0H13DRAFT_1899408 [Mycena leptocephala]|nr:hypothetical protein B0H13DRAFT_1899408 [Mycena leptocephala]